MTELAIVSDPLSLLLEWRDEAQAAGLPEPDAVALATVDAEGRPAVRMVLFRGLSEGGLRFFTHQDSPKGRALALHPDAAMAFHWALLARQVRVEGRTERLSDEESDEYFRQRPRGHQLNAWASPQSQPIASLAELRDRQSEFEARFEGREVPRPPSWGGYRLVPRAMEFWRAGADRFHDRVRYERAGSVWTAARLAP